MQMKLRRSNDIYIIDVSGEMDLYNAAELKTVFLKMKNKQIRKIIINMDDVDYIDSSGVGTLINIYSEAKERHIGLYLTNIHGTVQKVLQLTKLLGFFPIKPTVEDALLAL